jgi:hypothetical protein
VRQLVAWAGMALFCLGGVLAVFVGASSLAGVARHTVRVHVAQGLVVLSGALGVFGMGVAVTFVGDARLIPLGVGFIGLSLAIGAYGARLAWTRP